MLVQSGKPVGVMRTHEWAPRVLIANSNLVGDWANWEEFRRLEDLGPDDVRPDDRRLVDLHRHPGHPPGHLRDLRRGRRQAVRRDPRRHHHPHRRPRRHGRRAAAGRHDERRRRDLRRRRPARGIERRVEHRYLDVQADSTSTTPSSWPLAARDERRAAVDRRARQRRRRAARRCSRRGVPDRHRHRPDLGARPALLPARGRRPSRTGHALRDKDPEGFTERARESMARHVRGDGRASRTPAPRSSTTATRSATRPARAATTGPSTSPASCPAYIRPLFCEGKGPFRWAALSGDPADIAATDQAILELFPDNERLHKWITMAGERVAFQGLPARICWLGYGERHRPALKFNEMVASRRAQGARSSSAATTSTAARSPRRTARPRRCSTAPTRSPTGRCSTPWSTPRPAPPGSRSTTAAASASAARSTPARSASPTAPTWPRRRSSGC